MSQLKLFGDTAGDHVDALPLARRKDPATSRAAAEEMTRQLGLCHWLALQAAADLCRRGGDATAQEIGRRAAELSTKPAETFRKRVHELVRLGRLFEFGERRCSTSGKMARTFRVNKEGSNASSDKEAQREHRNK